MSSANNENINHDTEQIKDEKKQNVTIKDVLKHFTGKEPLSNEQQEKLKEISKDIRNLPGI